MKCRLLTGCVVLALVTQGCGHSPRPSAKAPPANSSTTFRELRADEFGHALAELLRSDRRHGQKALAVTALVRLQLARATQLFDKGERTAGLLAVQGALFLVKAGEARPEMWQGAELALAAAAEEAARIGNEGRARALYSLVKQSKPAKSLVISADEHLAAMDQFASRSGAEHVLEQTGDAQRVAVERSLYEPSLANLEAASRQITQWIQTALASDALERWGDEAFDRQEATEAYRAKHFGVITLVATYMRQGDPMGAIDWLEKSNLGSLATAELRDRLEQAGEADDLTAWGQFYQFFRSKSESSRTDAWIDAELAEAAAFGASVELYRSHPESLVAVGPLALMLADYQLGDAVPSMLLGALGERPGREEINWATSLLMRAMLVHGEAGDLQTTRRIFQDAEPVLKQAITLVKQGEVLRPHPARLYRGMATFEARFAELDRAKLMLAKSVELEPTTLGFVELGRIDRQRGDVASALSFIDKACAYAKTVSDELGAAEAQTVRFELLSEQGDVAGAERALREALDHALGARDKAQRPVEQAQAERRFARILELYGKQEGAERALKRALGASRADAQQLSVTILEAARRALVRDDLGAARQALRDAQEYGLRSEDCTYVALWLRLLERRRGLPSDGTVEELLSRAGELAYWPSKLRAWLLGQLSEQELERLARREPERIELAFYRVMLGPFSHKSADFFKVISHVASSRAVGLVEVAISQDLVRGERKLPQPTWPTGLTVP